MTTDFCEVTELAGTEVSQEQVERLRHRYYWAGEYSVNKDVVEVACGTGQGVGYLKDLAKSCEAGDYSDSILEIARNNYGDRFNFAQFDAMAMPFADSSKDIIILFEAIYYIPSAERFVQECKRVLRNGGKVLVATANKNLYDFNPSPHSFEYYGVVGLGELFVVQSFSCQFFGYMPVTSVSLRQKILRPIKKMAVSLNLMPKTMIAKKILKKLMFGNLIPMPAEICVGDIDYMSPDPIDPTMEDNKHKVLYCCATLQEGE